MFKCRYINLFDAKVSELFLTCCLVIFGLGFPFPVPHEMSNSGSSMQFSTTNPELQTSGKYQKIYIFYFLVKL